MKETENIGEYKIMRIQIIANFMFVKMSNWILSETDLYALFIHYVNHFP